MTPVMKLKPAAIAALVGNKRKPTPPNPPLFEDLAETTDAPEPTSPPATKPASTPEPEGNHTSLAEIPIPERALAPGPSGDYNQYTVVSPMPVLSGRAMPWFGQPGRGSQFYTPIPPAENSQLKKRNNN